MRPFRQNVLTTCWL